MKVHKFSLLFQLTLLWFVNQTFAQTDVILNQPLEGTQGLTITARQSITLATGFHAKTGSSVNISINQSSSGFFQPFSSSASRFNSIENISYNEKGSVVGQNITYIDDLGRNRQTLSRNFTNNSVIVLQSIYDALGREALSTLPAPVAQQSMNYINKFIANKDGTGEYSYSNFDEKTTADEISGPLANYYSNNNIAEPYIPASTYPYSRVEYSKLDPNVIRKSCGAGEAHYLGSGHENQSYSMASDVSELSPFGVYFSSLSDINLKKTDVIKTISVDASGLTNVVYSSSTGQLISSCYADENVAPIAVAATIQASIGYYDIHISKTSNVIITGGSCYVYDLSTDQLRGTYSNTVTLSKGFYRFVAVPVSGVTTSKTLSYNLFYTGHSFNLYNKADQLVFSISPKSYKEWVSVATKNIDELKKYATYYEYNSLGWLHQTSSPDEGITKYLYRRDGKLRFLQNEQQRANSKFSYINYDSNDRPCEVGEYSSSSGGKINFVHAYGGEMTSSPPYPSFTILDNTFSYTNPDADGLEDSHCLSKTTTWYDSPMDAKTYNGYSQKFLSGKVSKTQNNNCKTWYSYRYDGKIEWIIQELPEIGTKTIEYIYDDEILGNVEYVIYQKGQADEFRHHYIYDADNRLEYVYTQKRNESEKKQARYIYYTHGPIKRVELENKLQGIDYVYTITGALKSINHPSATDKDPGKDGYTGTNLGFEKDIFGLTLDYYSGDYQRTGTNISFASGTPTSNYNGNIAAQRFRERFNSYSYVNDEEYYLFHYSYDNLGRFKESKLGLYRNDIQGYFGHLYEKVGQYDENGNIKYLERSEDKLTYNYLPNSNKLNYISDAGTAQNGLIENQSTGNYVYDQIGRTIASKADNQYFEYEAEGHVSVIYKDAARTQKLAEYYYNESGYRIKKIAYHTGVPQTTWYVYDGGGQLMAVYTKENTNAIALEELPIYGSSRLGTLDLKQNRYIYELTDHLGNVRATVSRNANNLVEVLNTSIYYPFGSVCPLLAYVGSKAYRFGYQGEYSEKDAESGYNHFEVREYDSRIGRWLVPDPAGQYWSPYVGMGNNPVYGVDPDGSIFGFGRRADFIRAFRENNPNLAGSVARAMWRDLKNPYTMVFMGLKDDGTSSFLLKQGSIGEILWNDPQLFRSMLKNAPTRAAQGLLWQVRSSFGSFQYSKAINGLMAVFTAPMIIAEAAVLASNVTASVMNIGGRFTAGSISAEAPVINSGSRVWEVGSYNGLRGVEAGLDAHHVGQKALMNKFVPGYNSSTAPSILVPKLGHTQGLGVLSRNGSGLTNARQVIARDIFELRRVYPNIPNSSLQELIRMNKTMYPNAF